MRIDVHIHLSSPEILAQLHQLFVKVTHMSQQIDALVTQVSETNSVMDSAIVLLRGLKQRLDEAGTDPVKLEELRAALDSKEQELAQAIVENTPAQP